MEYKQCKACLKVKETTEFHKNNQYKDKFHPYCRICVSQGFKKHPTLKKQSEKDFNKQNRLGDKGHYRIAAGRYVKEDYRLMYELLKIIGYDINGDIHEQFLTRHNRNLKIPMKYKNRHYTNENL